MSPLRTIPHKPCQDFSGKRLRRENLLESRSPSLVGTYPRHLDRRNGLNSC